MFKLGLYKRIEVSDEYITIGTKRIRWSDIVGIRNYNNWLVHQLCFICPYSTLFLKGGRVTRIPSRFILEGIPPKRFGNKFNKKFSEYFTVIDFLSNKVGTKAADKFGWLEWRLVLPSGLIEVALMFQGFISQKELQEVIETALIGCILVLPIGWFWERMARKKKWI